MQKRTILTIFVLSLFRLRCANEHVKCCLPGQQIRKNGSDVKCESNSNKRVQTVFINNNFLTANVNGSCIEVISGNQTAVFSISGNGKIEENFVEKLFYPKCCPLRHLYDRKLHSCRTAGGNSSEDHIADGTFVYVGLPKCKIISDMVLDRLDNIVYTADSVELQELKIKFEREKGCVDSTVDSKFIVRTCSDNLDICNGVRCVQKCCPDGQSFVNGSSCKDTFRYGVDLRSTRHFVNPDAPFAVIHGIQRPIYPMKSSKNFSIDENGTFSQYHQESDSYIKYEVSEGYYCIEYAYKKGKFDSYMVFGRMVKPKLQLKFEVTRWLKLISCLFLVLTIAVYLILPKMMNLFGKILISYCFAALMFYFFLAISQFYYESFNDATCKSLGFISIWTSLCTFTWMQIMCIDIWFSFGSPRTLSGPLQRNEIKRFVQYSVYGWGFPLIWMCLIIIFNLTEVLPYALHPYIGHRKCYMENYESKHENYAYAFFLTLPLLIQQLVNVSLFVRTIRYCLKIRNEIEKMNESNAKKNYTMGKEKLHLVIKLAVVMGISFLFETISSIYDFNKTRTTRVIEVIGDSINCLQGLFIFVIFICKRKMLNDLKERFKIGKWNNFWVNRSGATMQSSMSMSNSKTETIKLEQMT